MKHLVVTGGHGDLGRAIAGNFTGTGWQPAAPGREELDVTVPASIHRFFENRPIDLLVCAAGITRDAPLARLGETAWDEVMGVNYQGAAACARAVLPEMIRRRAGHIVFISSHSALHPPAGQSAYAASKAALLGLTVSLARSHGRENIRVNAILPGFLETRMTHGVTPERRADILADHALGRLNHVEQVAAFIHHLHERLPHTSGQFFQLDSRC